MLVLIIWLICAFICYSIADKYNMNKTIWAVLGALFGVFAVVAAMAFAMIKGK